MPLSPSPGKSPPNQQQKQQAGATGAAIPRPAGRLGAVPGGVSRALGSLGVPENQLGAAGERVRVRLMLLFGSELALVLSPS